MLIKEGCWICGKFGHRKKDCYIHKRKMKSYKDKKGNASNDPTMKDNFSQGDLIYYLDLNQNDSTLNESSAGRSIILDGYWTLGIFSRINICSIPSQMLLMEKNSIWGTIVP